MLIIIFAVIILLIILWFKMVKHGSKNVNTAVNQINDIKADKARKKAAGITKEDLKQLKKQNIERRKAGLPELDWDGVPFENKMRK
jgi:5-bromo-4-chloroindolyl phosphate hydrolysis protein